MSSQLDGALLDDRYRIRDMLYEGSTALLYKVLNVRLNRVEVAKVSCGALSEHERMAFDREVRIAKDLGGEPNIPRIWNAGLDSGLFTYMVMEAGGDPLDPAGRWDLGRVFEVMIELTTAAGSVHNRGYLHNAIRPCNILVRSPGDVMLIDFGVACRQEEAEGRSLLPLDDHESVAFTAPECRTGGPVGVASDVYSLGAVLDVLVAAASSQRLPAEIPADPRSSGGGKGQLHLALRRVVARATSPDPDARYPTVWELQDELQRLRYLNALGDATTASGLAGNEPEEPVVVRPHSRVLDFGEVHPGDSAPAPVRTFEVRSVLEAEGVIECHASWLEVRPHTFRAGVTAVTVSLLPEALPHGVQSEAQIQVQAPGSGHPRRIGCWVRHLGGVDLVLILDTIGNEESLRARREFAHGVLTEAEQGLREFGELRVGVLAYGEYGLPGDFIHPVGSEPLRRYDLGLLPEGLSALGELAPVSSRDFEVAAEAALAALKGLHWRPLSAHCLVSVGNRPPHPVRTGTFQQVASPGGQDWRGLLVEARRWLRPRNICVLDEVVWPAGRLPAHAETYMAEFWHEFADVALLRLERTSPAEVVRLLAENLAQGVR